ncbi:CHAT domain-containing protein [Aquimarina sp. 2201CG14-23]|uniref:CHAT domain-containing protein n=1 Tax=Aquimarina mycalae TaxID=3040073 RepID=UPI00247801D8|nr:CHAT domain-containing protein [Aquimarina sp. 2201CG14-23]MDH7448364.1 CHAT domain-containing protein [Aquimarina sp. 2201CG14-23]
MKNIVVTMTLFMFLIGFSQNENDLIDFDFFLNKGGSFLYSQKDSAYYYLNKSYQIAENIDYLDGKLNVLPYLTKANAYHFDLDSLKRNLDRFERLIGNNSRLDTILYGTIYKRRFLLEKGQYFYKIKNYTESIRWITFLINDLEKIPKQEITVDEIYELNSSYSFMASIYENIGKLEFSKEYHEKTLSIAKKYSDIDLSRQVANTNMRYARVYEKEKDFEKANTLLNESLMFYEAQKDNPRLKNSLLSTYQRLTQNYLLQDSIARAIHTLKESEVYYAENESFKRSAELLYGDIYLKDSQFDKAEVLYQSYLSKIKEYRQNQKHQDVAEAFARLGRLYMAKGNAKKALAFYQESLIQLAPNFESKEIDKNPDPIKVFSKLEFIKVLKEKLEAQRLLFQENNDIEDIKTALITSYSLINTLDLLKPEFESKVDKQFLISEMYPAFHEMVEVAYDLYISTNNANYISDAFHFIEKSKSILLLEATRSAQASSFGTIPEDIIDKEQQYRANIIHLEKKMFNKKSNTVILDSLFKLKNKYYDFISDIEQNYPKYYDLKYNAEVVSLEDASSVIIENKALLSFFSTDTNLFLVTLQKDKKAFYKIPLAVEDRNRIANFYEMLSKIDVEDMPAIYAEGYLIYEQLLKIPLQELDSKELIIIPDDVLNYLPFEALSKSETPQDYLIKEYQICYANSVTMLKEQKNKVKTSKNQLLAYAPSFGKVSTDVQSERSDFGPLLYNTKEVRDIVQYFNGKAIVGNDASLSSFSEYSPAYNILHFATHAAANDQFPDYSYLAFSVDSTAETSLLYVKDLYGYAINADLVALSACQTGLGKLQKGEGMLSLARGFSYAGAKSLVTTLWKINDQTTSELMSNFYKNLSNSSTKDKALRDAKLQYLETVDDELLKHPYYWSGFMISGNMMPLKTDNNYLWWLVLLSIPILVIIIRKLKNV